MAESTTTVTPEVQALFDELHNPKHASKRTVHDQLRPIMKMGALVRKQLAEYHDLYMDATLGEHDAPLDPKLARLKNYITPIDQLAPQFLAIGDQLKEAFQNLERVRDEDAEWFKAMSELAHAPKPETPVVAT